MGIGVRSREHMLSAPYNNNNNNNRQQAAPPAGRTSTTISTTTSSSGSSGGSLNTIAPCAACKLLRRRCAEECPFSPYFSPLDPLKFAAVHKVFGASNVSKLLLEVPEMQRADAANSLVYEANLRLRDPVYGCMGAISALQHQIQSLTAELNAVRAEILKHKYKEAAHQVVVDNLNSSPVLAVAGGCGTSNPLPRPPLMSTTAGFSPPPAPPRDSDHPHRHDQQRPLTTNSSASSNSSSSASSSLYATPTTTTAYSSISTDHPYLVLH